MMSTDPKDVSLTCEQLLEREKFQCVFQELKDRTLFRQREKTASNQHEDDAIGDEPGQRPATEVQLQKSHDPVASDREKKAGMIISTEMASGQNTSPIICYATNQHEVPGRQEQVDPRPPESELDTERLRPVSILHRSGTNSRKTAEVSFTSGEKVEPRREPACDPDMGPPPAYAAPQVILDAEKLPPCPCRTQCPECRQYIMTETSSSVSSVTWMLCFSAAMIGCLAGCCLVPFCFDKFKSITHRCPKCRTSILTVKRL